MAKTVKVGKDGTPKTLSQIAKKQGVTLQALLAANPKIKDANLIKMNQSINIPDTKKMPGAKGGPYGRVSQTEMNLMRGDGRQYTTGVRAKMKAGAETSPTPKKARTTVDEKSGRSALLAKAKTKKLQKEGKLPVSGVAKKRAEAAKEKERQKKNRERLAALRKKTANKNGTTMAMPKPKPKTQTASRASRRKGRKA
tara:strand:- start:193 stop:783 length:591 start_codon:yes stop_codon:yes gene_type:complete